MKICILQGAFLPIPPVRGGAVEKMWYLLGRKFVEKGHEVTHVSRKYPGFSEEEFKGGVRHLRVRSFDAPSNPVGYKILDGIYTINALPKIPADADVVVSNTFWAPILVPIFRRVPVYVDVARMPKGQMRLYRMAWVLRANSTPVVDAITKELGPSAFPRVSLVPNPLPMDLPEELGTGCKQPVILYCGRLHPEKGLHLLAWLARRLPAGWRLRFVGPWEARDGGGGASYLKQLQEIFADCPVDLTGPVYDIEQLNRIYAEARVFVYPSVAERGETFGLAPLEAMAFGCVPVVSDLACFKDFIVHGENGLIFDHRLDGAAQSLGETVLGLLTDEGRLRVLAEKALLVRESHSADRIADQFLQDFERMRE